MRQSPGVPMMRAAGHGAHAGAHVNEVNAGHLSLISEPGTVTRVIMKAASATS
jgi:hypothetical protein